MFDSRYDPSRQLGRDDETGTLPNIPDITAGQSPAANGPAAALLRSAVPEERPTHFVIRILWPATYSAVGQSAKMSDSRAAAVRLSDGESEIFGGFFARGYHNSPQRRTSAFLCCACSAWQCCKINKDRDVCFTQTRTYTYKQAHQVSIWLLRGQKRERRR